jgi:hypothetical protein
MIIGITGLIGSGKDTIASHLVEKYGYERYSWATPLKDITATLFGWDRDMLEGVTIEQREKREQVDPWWDKKLNKYDLVSPRWVLQFIGTEVMRNTLHQDIWVLAGMKRIEGKQNVVIPDTRFPNEIKAIKEMGGVIWNVQRGPVPEWYEDFKDWQYKNKNVAGAWPDGYMASKWPNVHASEYSWVGTEFDAVFQNNTTIERLTQSIDSVIGN